MNDETGVRECVCGREFEVVTEHAKPWTVCSHCMMAEWDSVPPCPVCSHEHAATWEGGRLIATAGCYCGCLIETIFANAQKGKP